MPQGAECVPQKGPSALAVECMHAWPVHGNGVTKGAAHVLGGPANMSMKVILGLCRWGQHDRQERSDWGENQGTPRHSVPRHMRTTTLPTAAPESMYSMASGTLSRPSKARLPSTSATSSPGSGEGEG